MSQNAPQNKLSVTHKILIVGFGVVLTAVVVGYLFISNNNQSSMYGSSTPYASGSSYLVDESNITEIEEKAAQEVADGMFLTTMNMEWGFTSSNEASYNAYVANDASNSRPVFIEVVLDGEDEPIFRSTVIPPGSALKEVTLGKNLKKGSYNAVCTYFLLNEDTNEVVSSLSLEILIQIDE